MTNPNEGEGRNASGPEKAEGPKQPFYFVDGKRYESEHTTLTGLQIKTRIPDFDTTFDLFQESKGDEPDRLVRDNDTITLSFDKGPVRFYTVPPATFG